MTNKAKQEDLFLWFHVVKDLDDNVDLELSTYRHRWLSCHEIISFISIEQESSPVHEPSDCKFASN